MSFLKGGIVFSRLITTVSPHYAREIQTPSFGFGFDGILRHRAADLIGILNGIDYDQWDPCRDRYLPVPYDASRIEGKSAAKRLVLEQFGLPADERCAASAARGNDLAAGRPEGSRSGGARSRMSCRHLEASFVLLGTGEQTIRGSVARPSRGDIRIESAQDWLRRSAGTPDRRRSGYVPDALTLRTVRPQPDVQPSLRNGPGRASDRRPVRHRSGAFDPSTGEGTGFTFEPVFGRGASGDAAARAA